MASPKKEDRSVNTIAGLSSWCIFVKTVGQGFEDLRRNEDESNRKGMSDGTFSFSVEVSPNDRVDFLHEKIEGVTGVKASQQRLIYRGKLIGKADVSGSSSNGSTNYSTDENENADNIGTPYGSDHKSLTGTQQQPRQEQSVDEYRIKDIVGLCDGQTIHLVRKRETDATATTTAPSSTEDSSEFPTSFRDTENNNDENASTSTDSDRGGGGGALLAALLGLGSLGEDGPRGPEVITARRPNPNTNTRTNDTTERLSSPWRSSILRGERSPSRVPRSIRRPTYRLAAEDLEVEDPGSMESVRQGLMTLNTIMNSQSSRTNNQQQQQLSTTSATPHHPLGTNREWFRGQWIDARDTVNQWLEATVIDIVDPKDVLDDSTMVRIPAVYESRYANPEEHPPRQRRVPNVDNDPAISANDFEGRRRLLLEECDPGDPREIRVPSTNTPRQRSFRPRSSNQGVQLLLIHYNGWPHRWDEWIRSDSERIRPFRTRTRHPTTSSMASPTPQSILHETPRTNIVQGGDEEDDRLAVLPELNLALSRVSGLVGDLVRREQRTRDHDGDDELEDLHQISDHPAANATSLRVDAGLPWMARRNSTGSDDHDPSVAMNANSNNTNNNPLGQTNNIDAQAYEEDYERGPFRNSATSDRCQTTYTQAELRNLATLFDRLGRTLTDAAPHIASLVATVPERHEEDTTTSSAASSSQQAASDATVEHSNNSSMDFDTTTSSAPLGGLLSLWSRERERRRQNPDAANDAAAVVSTTSRTNAPIDPDHLDFASGVVNTTRGEVRSGQRSRASQQHHQDDVASLLGTYLAAASLGNVSTSNDDGENTNPTSGLARLLQRGGGHGESNSNGIDIHIHTIVTGPGISPGGMGIAAMGAASPTAILGGAQAQSLLPQSPGTSLSSNIVEPTTDPEDYNDLFSELYSESPTPIDPNGSTDRPRETHSLPGRNRGTENNDSTTNTPPLASPTSSSGSSDTLEEASRSAGVVHPVTPPSTNNTSSSSSRRQSSERRSSGVFRLFRRRSSSRANNRDGSSNEES